MNATKEQIESIISSLEGTSQPLEAAVESVMGVSLNDLDNDSEVEEAIREALFECDHCGWWASGEELTECGDGLERCFDCSQDFEEDEEDGDE